MARMRSLVTNDRVTLKYHDTGASNEQEALKPWLVLVSSELISIVKLLSLLISVKT